MFGLNKYIVYAIAIAIIGAVVTTYVLVWKHNIRQQALLDFNQKQMEQTIADQKKFVKTLEEITKDQQKIVADLKERNEKLDQKLQSLTDWLDAPETQSQDRTSSEILKRTIKELGGK